ncbi:MAG: Uma2 family endonuclease [Chloroflexota bacterium]|nr:Uma2 family endonuclease [Chloroflexota bacterium]
MATKTLMTVEDLATLPDGGERYELINGEPRKKPMPNGEHAFATLAVGGELWAYARREGLGVALADARFRLQRNPDVSRLPDVAYVRREVWDAMDHRAPALEGVPDVAVEIVSPSDVYGEVHQKALDWLAAGVRLVWVVQPLNRTVTVYARDRESLTLTVDDALDGEDVIPGFRMPVRALFQ